MNEQDYRLLLDLYKTKNITRVAHLHYLSQPAMTKRIRRSEEELGSELILRSQKGITFTPAGELAVDYCRKFLELSGQMRNGIHQASGTVSGSLTIGCSLNFSRYRLPTALKKYQELYPQVDIVISTGHSDFLYQQLLDNRVSVAIVRGAHTWPEGAVQLALEPVCLVSNPQFVGHDLSRYPYIGHHTDSRLEKMTAQWLLEHGLSPEPKLWIDDIFCCRSMAEAGVGWTIVPHICLNGFVGNVTPLFLKDGTPLERETTAIYRNAQADLPQVRYFIDILVENEARYAQLHSPIF